MQYYVLITEKKTKKHQKYSKLANEIELLHRCATATIIYLQVRFQRVIYFNRINSHSIFQLQIDLWNFQHACKIHLFQFICIDKKTNSIRFLIFLFFIFQITFKYENDLLEELAFKFFDYDEDCLSNGLANVTTESAVVNNIQAKLLRMENAYAKRVKIQGICYKKKIGDFQRTIMELNRQMQVSCRVFFGLLISKVNDFCWFC